MSIHHDADCEGVVSRIDYEILACKCRVKLKEEEREQ